MGGLYSTPARPGYRVASAIASIIAATTSVVLFNQPYDSQTMIIRKIIVNNRQVSPVTVTFGTGTTAAATFVAQLPGFYAINGQDNEWTEDQLPAYEWSGNISVEATAGAASPSDVQVMIEVELIGGSSVHA